MKALNLGITPKIFIKRVRNLLSRKRNQHQIPKGKAYPPLLGTPSCLLCLMPMTASALSLPIALSENDPTISSQDLFTSAAATITTKDRLTLATGPHPMAPYVMRYPAAHAHAARTALPPRLSRGLHHRPWIRWTHIYQTRAGLHGRQ